MSKEHEEIHGGGTAHSALATFYDLPQVPAHPASAYGARASHSRQREVCWWGPLCSVVFESLEVLRGVYSRSSGGHSGQDSFGVTALLVVTQWLGPRGGSKSRTAKPVAAGCAVNRRGNVTPLKITDSTTGPTSHTVTPLGKSHTRKSCLDDKTEGTQ